MNMQFSFNDSAAKTPQELWQTAVQAHQAGNLAQARMLYEQILAAQPAHADALHLLGVVTDQQGSPLEAIELIKRSIALQAANPESHNNLGLALQATGKLREAEDAYRQAVGLNANYIAAQFNLARVLMMQGKMEDAQPIAQLVVSKSPREPEAVHLLASILHQQHRMPEAESHYRNALQLKPNYGAALHNLATLLLSRPEGKEEALRLLKDALSQNPRNLDAWFLQGSVAQADAKMEEAQQAFRKVIEINPEHTKAHFQLGILELGACNVPESVRLLQKAVMLNPADAEAHSTLLLAMHYSDSASPQQLSDAAKEWAKKHTAGISRLPSLVSDRSEEKVLRIGYISGDLRDHPVGSFLESVLQAHDHGKVHITCYANSAHEDNVSMQLKTQANVWRNIADQSDDKAAQTIRGDKIDILVDLSGHTARNRLACMAAKPAPVQATWMGYFDTTGIDAIDYIIADAHVIRAGEEALYAEKPERLPDSYLCFTPPPYALQPGSLPSEKAGYVTFGCFNYLSKVTPKVVEIWSTILKQAPNTRLFLKSPPLASPDVKARYVQWFADQGIEAGRLCMEGPAPREALIACYQDVDIALDPFPYNGGTTTVEALWMGVPVIALSGDRFVSRVSESILKTVDAGECVAGNVQDYVQKAVALAKDTQKRSEYRTTLRDKLLQSPVCDAKRFAGNLEASYRRMWHAWCKGA